MLSTAFLTHPEAYDQVNRQECVRVDLGTGVTQKLSTDFIRVVHQTSRNQFAGNRTWVRIPPAAPASEQAFYRLLRLIFSDGSAWSDVSPGSFQKAEAAARKIPCRCFRFPLCPDFGKGQSNRPGVRSYIAPHTAAGRRSGC